MLHLGEGRKRGWICVRNVRFPLRMLKKMSFSSLVESELSLCKLLQVVWGNGVALLDACVVA